jgi:hypothetical protein
VPESQLSGYVTVLGKQNFIELFQEFGSSLNWLSEEKLNEVQKFVCSMYGSSNYISTDTLRHDLFKARYEPKSSRKSLRLKNGIDLSLLPPCKSSLRMHCLRANYQAFIWRNSHIAGTFLPSPIGNGWKYSSDGTLEVEWTDGDILPRQLVDILASNQGVDSQNSAETAYDSVPEDMIEEDELDNILDIVFEEEEDD